MSDSSGMKRVHSLTAGSRRSGRSLYYAGIVAADIKAGKPIHLVSHDPNGKVTIEPIVGVPGFDDGRQITDKSNR